MKIFLVGGLGFIGKRFIKKFANNHQLIVFAKKETITKFSDDIDITKVIIEEGNIEDENLEKVILKHNPDVVVNLAALTGLAKCHDDPETAFRINVYGTYNLLKACTKVKPKIIFISSREVYGETRNKESSEDDELFPNNTYGITKMLGEILVIQEGLQNNLDYTILRLTNVYGPEGNNYGVQKIIKKALKENKIQIWGGMQRMNFIFVDDVVDSINIVLANKKSSNQIFNIGSKDTLRFEEFATKLAKIMKGDIEMEHLPMRETETSNFLPNLRKANEYLDFEAKTSLDFGLKKTIEWYSKT